MDRHGHKKPIDFQTNKLPFAVGLTEPERVLLQEMRISQKQLPGTTETRRRIGQYLFGARVEYGDPLFITLTPTMRHNALILNCLATVPSTHASKKARCGIKSTRHTCGPTTQPK